MTLTKGDVVLVPFPFTDLKQAKVRPGIVLWASATGSDVLLCFVSSQNTDCLTTDEMLIDPGDREFAGTGLRVQSKIRVTRATTVERKLIQRRLGRLGPGQLTRLNATLMKALQLE